MLMNIGRLTEANGGVSRENNWTKDTGNNYVQKGELRETRPLASLHIHAKREQATNHHLTQCGSLARAGLSLKFVRAIIQLRSLDYH